MSLSTMPPRGTKDWFPEEFRIRKYIFDTRRKVCLSFGYEEYLGPLVEDANMYRAKSGEDVGGSELTLLTDKEGNITDISLRPEMTPSVTRMVASRYAQLPKPVRRFSIANFYRNERPQRGRNREFRQLNVDMFGEDGRGADIETLQMAVEVMKAFNPPKDSFIVYVNHRHLIEAFLKQIVQCTDEQKRDLTRLMDKRDKLTLEVFRNSCAEKGAQTQQIADIVQFMSVSTIEQLISQFPALASHESLTEISEILVHMQELGYADYIQFKPGLMRGFDYYDGMVFEVFDRHPDNNRAMFGGGRYNGLAEIFGVQAFPAVGMAPGDEPMRLFLESRNMLDNVMESQSETYYLPVLDEGLMVPAMILAAKLRAEGKYVECGTSVKKLGKAIEYADKKGMTFVIIFGETEREKGVYVCKEMKTGEERIESL